jgi:hypothetical protein
MITFSMDKAAIMKLVSFLGGGRLKFFVLWRELTIHNMIAKDNVCADSSPIEMHCSCVRARKSISMPLNNCALSSALHTQNID